jgi:hypothetical protein
MIVICNKGTRTTVKGGKYEVASLYNDGTNGRLEGKVCIKEFGKFNVGNFSDISGNPLPKINISSKVGLTVGMDFYDLKEGDVLVCTSDAYVIFARNGMYKIKKLFTVSYVNTFNKKTYYSHFIKFEGISRRIMFNAWKFRKLTTSEARDMSLNTILTGEAPKIIKKKGVNKLDLIDNKEGFLIESIMKSILDPRRHKLSVIEWVCDKIVPSYKLSPEDFNELTNLTFKEILKKVDEK